MALHTYPVRETMTMSSAHWCDVLLLPRCCQCCRAAANAAVLLLLRPRCCCCCCRRPVPHLAALMQGCLAHKPLRLLHIHSTPLPHLCANQHHPTATATAPAAKPSHPQAPQETCAHSRACLEAKQSRSRGTSSVAQDSIREPLG
jgi:hypothetical protein